MIFNYLTTLLNFRRQKYRLRRIQERDLWVHDLEGGSGGRAIDTAATFNLERGKNER